MASDENCFKNQEILCYEYHKQMRQHLKSSENQQSESLRVKFIPLSLLNFSSLKIEDKHLKGKKFTIIPLQTKIKRRLAANERERRRMKNLNKAFDNLRKYLPSPANQRQLSKYETLLIAQSYITALCKLLQ